MDVVKNATFYHVVKLCELNTVGKSTMLSAIGERELPIPDHIDIFHLTEEYTASDKTALEAVIEVRTLYHSKVSTEVI